MYVKCLEQCPEHHKRVLSLSLSLSHSLSLTSRMQYFTLMREVSSIQNAGRKKKNTGSVLSKNT